MRRSHVTIPAAYPPTPTINQKRTKVMIIPAVLSVKVFTLNISPTNYLITFCMFISSLTGSDGSSDDEPLVKMKTSLAPPKKQEKKENTPPKSNSTNNKNTGDPMLFSSFVLLTCV